jgi:hypothetical protein
VSISPEDHIEFVACFAGYGFLSVAKHLRELKDEHATHYDDITKLIGMDRGDAELLVRLDRTFRDLDIGENHMVAIGWPKLIVLVDHISSVNRQQLLELADKTSAKELASILGQPPSGTRRMVLHLTQEQYRVLEEAILAHGGVRSARHPDELSGKEEALVKALAAKRD